MRSLLVLSVCFALLAVYLEQTAPQAHAALASHQPAKVIRHLTEPQAAQVAVQPAVTIHKAEIRNDSPLNLTLPAIQGTDLSLDSRSSSMLNLFDYRGKEKVSYNAELVFDRETGEDITGGKVHIKIPLS